MDFDDGEAAFAHLLLEGWVFENFDNIGAESGSVARGAEIAVFTVFDEFADGAGADGDGGEAGGHGFHEDDTLGFGGGRNAEDLTDFIELGEIVANDAAGENGGGGDTKFGCEFFELGFVGAVTDEDELGVWKLF